MLAGSPDAERRRHRRAADRADPVSHGLHVEETRSARWGARRAGARHDGPLDRLRQGARRLDDRYRVLATTGGATPGRGAASGPHGCEAHVDDLLNLLDGRHATIVGHSYGGNVALAASVRAPEPVNAVGMYETPLPWQSWWPGTTAPPRPWRPTRPAAGRHAAEQFLRRLLGDELWERLPERTRVARRAEGHALVAEMVDLRSRSLAPRGRHRAGASPATARARSRTTPPALSG